MKCGDDVRFDDNVVFKYPDKVSLGNHVAFSWGFYCTAGLEMMDQIHIAAYCSVIGGPDSLLKMGYFSGMAAGCRIICASDDYGGESLIVPWLPMKYRKIVNKPVILEDFVTLGTNTIVFPGVTIAQGTVTGAGTVVRESTEPWSVYVGTPARLLKPRSRKIVEYAKELGYNIPVKS